MGGNRRDAGQEAGQELRYGCGIAPGETLMAGGFDFAWCYVWFKEIPGHEGYIAGSDGTVWSTWKNHGVLNGWTVGETLRNLKVGINERGYAQVCVKRTGTRKHYTARLATLILTTFVGDRPDPSWDVAHFPSDDKADNRLSNLRWATKKDNQADRYVHGTDHSGEKNYLSKFPDSEIPVIIGLRATGMSYQSIANRYNVTLQCIWNIVHGKNRNKAEKRAACRNGNIKMPE